LSYKNQPIIFFQLPIVIVIVHSVTDCDPRDRCSCHTVRRVLSMRTQWQIHYTMYVIVIRPV